MKTYGDALFTPIFEAAQEHGMLHTPVRASGRATTRGTAMEIEESAVGSAVVVSLKGRLDGVSAAELEARIVAIVKRGDIRVVLDCARMHYVSSAGLRAFLVGAKTCQHSGGRLMIADLQRGCRTVLEMSGFLSFIEYFETSDAALAILG